MSLISIPEAKESLTSAKDILDLTKQYSVLEQRVIQLEKQVADINERYRAHARLLIRALITIATGIATSVAVMHIKIL